MPFADLIARLLSNFEFRSIKGRKLKVFYKRGLNALGDYDRSTHTITIYHYLEKEVCNIGSKEKGDCLMCRRCFADETRHFVNALNHEIYHAINRNRAEKLWMTCFAMCLPFDVTSLFFRRLHLKFFSWVTRVILNWILARIDFLFEDEEQELAFEFARRNEGKINEKAWRIAESNADFLPDAKWLPDYQAIRAYEERKRRHR